MTFSVLILIVFFASFSIVLGAGFSWFGGNIGTTVPCTCTSGSWLVTIVNSGHNAIFNGAYVYSPATRKVTGKGIPGGTQILGLFSRGAGTCMMGVEPYCYSVPNIGAMTMIGTN